MAKGKPLEAPTNRLLGLLPEKDYWRLHRHLAHRGRRCPDDDRPHAATQETTWPKE
jgi:hypothetical protein